MVPPPLLQLSHGTLLNYGIPRVFTLSREEMSGKGGKAGKLQLKFPCIACGRLCVELLSVNWKLNWVDWLGNHRWEFNTFKATGFVVEWSSDHRDNDYGVLVGPDLSYWAFINFIGPDLSCWAFLDLTGSSLALLGLLGPYWAFFDLLGLHWPCWAFIGLVGPSLALLDLRGLLTQKVGLSHHPLIEGIFVPKISKC
ncbi:hypothetical protein E3N88_25901 [Mikania micrantha]|uniref:Uncharacterized protein n=1 Tax=Mikania micrantha TaxID=192012 RepID=A0A5N6N702_9ASTR|nr:hypothetical protein E3N88_25901 [Mikania micrantha]